MTLINVFNNAAKRFSVISAGLAFIVLTASACAQEEATAASSTAVEIDPGVFNLLLESRTQKSAETATEEEKDGVMGELMDVYLVTNLPRAAELAKEPTTAAQLELQRRIILFNAFATDFLVENAASEQEIFNTYEEQVTLNPPEEFKARHILVETQSEAVVLVSELDSGADFAELAKARSTGPSGPSGGDLGWFPAQAMVAPFSAAVAELEDGTYTKSPVQTQFGWHVILREDSRAGTPPPLESVRDVLKQRIEQEKLQNFVEGLREE